MLPSLLLLNAESPNEILTVTKHLHDLRLGIHPREQKVAKKFETLLDDFSSGTKNRFVKRALAEAL